MDLCLDCSTRLLFKMCGYCMEAEGYRGALRKEKE